MSKSNLVAFRVPADLQDAFNQAVAASGGDKSAWLVDAIRSKLNRPVADSDKRMLALVERMETAAAALIVGRSGIPPHPYNEKAVIAIVAQTIGKVWTMAESSLNGSMMQAIRPRMVRHGIRIFTAPGSARGIILS